VLDSVRLRLDLAYDGTDFAGWAAQPEQRTVEGELASALQVLCREPIRLVVAGRTDAGVHARGQVAHIDVSTKTQINLRKLNGLLPHDVRVFALGEAPPGFDARFSANRRTYRYRVSDRVVDPVRRRDTLQWQRPLDLSAMQAASSKLLGLNDFTAFCRAREGATAIRQLTRLDWLRDDEGVLTAIVEADAFCHSMVRSLVGSLLAVGDGRWAIERPASLLGADRRSDAVVVAPPQGLTLLSVGYPPDEDLARRAEETRTVRQLCD
jgi:tRNA pseudouridine38-40 synthase